MRKQGSLLVGLMAACVAFFAACTPAPVPTTTTTVAPTTTTVAPQDCTARGPGVDLQGCDLTSADLTSADLTGTNLRGADLTGAQIKGQTIISLLRRATRSDGYEFFLWHCEGGFFVGAGCRFMGVEEARKHWTETRGGTPLGDETMDILRFFAAAIKRAAPCEY